MLVLKIIFICLSFITVVLNMILDLKKNKKHKIINYCFLVILSLSSLLFILDKIINFNVNGFLHVLMISLSIGTLIYKEIATYKKKENNNVLNRITDILFFVLAIVAISVYYGFNFIEILFTFIFSLLFYLTKYLFKEKEDNNSLLLISYTLLVSYLLSSSLSILILSNSNLYDILNGLFMLIGSAIIYISYIFIKEENVLNNEVIIKEIKVNNITKNLVKIAVVFYLLALLFII